MIVRPLTEADALAFRIVRLEALRLHPDAYGSTLADWERMPNSAFVERIRSGVVFGLFTDKGLEGLLAYEREKGGNTRHRASLYTIYVRKSLRGSAAADMLMEAAIAQARADKVVQLELLVSETNSRAQAFYRRHGFEPYAVIPRALCVKGQYVDEVCMVLNLDA